ncbi:hypothetical protein [Pseudomonas sp. UBA4194]|nr:hypothetical protein [Pseudomonas sp. UBA4194]
MNAKKASSRQTLKPVQKLSTAAQKLIKDNAANNNGGGGHCQGGGDW